MSEIVLTIPAVPVAQPRQRHGIVGGHVRNFIPAKHPVHAFKASAKYELSKVYKGAPLSGPLTVQVCFVMPRPGRLNKAKMKPWPRVPHVQKPDTDNLCKSLFDALNNLAWIDDSQVCELLASKCHAGRDEQPHVRVVITETGGA
ncbi:MAG: RusA family crossover junction endodeoxyribonuclease [Elusimicrobia bacterium]|nr:RusA family crossover junction endodeoxyribonuclease [Elusimicrobiota bacterium]